MGENGWGATLKAELGLKIGKKTVARKRETRADAEKRERRQKTRKWTAYSGGDALQRKVESRLERFECTNYGDSLFEGDNVGADDGDSDDFVQVDNDESDESDDSLSDEDEDDEYGSSNKKGSKKGSTRKKTPASGRGTKKAPGTNKRKTSKVSKSRKSSKTTVKAKPAVAKRRRVRTLHELLLDENARKLATCQTLEDIDSPDYISARASPSRYPKRKFCAVTHVLAQYTDPESHLPYANMKALQKLKEQPPRWVKATSNAPFHEAMRIIDETRSRKRKELA